MKKILMACEVFLVIIISFAALYFSMMALAWMGEGIFNIVWNLRK